MNGVKSVFHEIHESWTPRKQKKDSQVLVHRVTSANCQPSIPPAELGGPHPGSHQHQRLGAEAWFRIDFDKDIRRTPNFECARFLQLSDFESFLRSFETGPTNSGPRCKFRCSGSNSKGPSAPSTRAVGQCWHTGHLMGAMMKSRPSGSG